MGSGVGIHSHCLVKFKILRTAWFLGYKMNLQAPTKQFPTEKVNAGFKHVVPILYLWNIIFLPVPTIAIKPELPEPPRTCQAMAWIWWGWNYWNGYVICINLSLFTTQLRQIMGWSFRRNQAAKSSSFVGHKTFVAKEDWGLKNVWICLYRCGCQPPYLEI